jgi:hypothetical protein
MIVKKIINGQAVGFDMGSNSYCNLPRDFKDPDASVKPNFAVMSKKQLIAYAAENGIDISAAHTIPGIIAILEGV